MEKNSTESNLIKNYMLTFHSVNICKRRAMDLVLKASEH